jgi:hypothetical protein
VLSLCQLNSGLCLNGIWTSSLVRRGTTPLRSSAHLRAWPMPSLCPRVRPTSDSPPGYPSALPTPVLRWILSVSELIHRRLRQDLLLHPRAPSHRPVVGRLSSSRPSPNDRGQHHPHRLRQSRRSHSNPLGHIPELALRRSLATDDPISRGRSPPPAQTATRTTSAGTNRPLHLRLNPAMRCPGWPRARPAAGEVDRLPTRPPVITSSSSSTSKP